MCREKKSNKISLHLIDGIKVYSYIVLHKVNILIYFFFHTIN